MIYSLFQINDVAPASDQHHPGGRQSRPAAKPPVRVAKPQWHAPQQLAPLDRESKAKLCIRAREAWEHVGSPGDFNSWRHEEQYRAVGKHSLCESTTRDYCIIMAHWWDLLGRSDIAFNLLLRAMGEDYRLALWKLREVCREKGFRIEYAAAVGRSIWKRQLTDLTPKQIWGLKFELEKRKARAGAHSPQSDPDRAETGRAEPGDPNDIPVSAGHTSSVTGSSDNEPF